MVEKIFESPEIYRIEVPLPKNPLRALNSYVIKTEERNLVIDTGFNRKECYDALTEGLKEIGIGIENTDFFITHLHGDHSGLVNKIASKNSRVYMSSMDYSYLKGDLENVSWPKIEALYEEEGFPKEIIESLKSSNQAQDFMPEEIFAVESVEDGQIISLSDLEFECILTPGHTPGHMCLYLKSHKILFSGDHILFDITPNITSWYGVTDSLKDYMENLRKLENLDIEYTFPGHRTASKDVKDRIREIIEHHEERLEEVICIINSNTIEMNAYEITQQMEWNLREASWDQFHMNQKWFAMGEALAHLDYLYNSGRITKKMDIREEMYKYLLN